MSNFSHSGIVIQAETNECGLACLAMVSGRVGHGATLSQLRRRFAVSSLGASAHDLVKWAQQLRMNAAACKVTMQQLGNISAPCVLHFSNHWVVLKKASRRHVTILDPAKGVRRLSQSEFAALYSGLALLFSGQQCSSRRALCEHQSARHLCFQLAAIPGCKTYLALLAGFAVLAQVTALGVPTFVSSALDNGLSSGGSALLILLGVTMTLIGIHALLEWLRALVVIRASETVSQQAASGVLAHMLKLTSGYYGRRQKSQLVERFRNVHRLSAALSDDIPSLLVSAVFASFTLLALSIFAGTIAWVSVAGMLVVGALWGSFSTRIRQAQHEELLAREAEYAHLHQTCAAINDIKLVNGEVARHQAYQQVVAKWLLARSRKSQLTAAARICTAGVSNLAHCIMVVIGVAGLGDAGSISIGVLFVVLALQAALFQHVQSLCQRVQSIVCRLPDLDLLDDILDGECEPPQPCSEGARRPHRAPGLSLTDIDVHRRGAPAPTLSALQLRVAPGEMLAITGANGAGKSTLADTLCGLVPPQRGQMRLHGRSLTALGSANWRAQFGVVRQDAALVDGSVARNVAFMSEHIDRSRVAMLIRQVGLEQWVAKQPGGMDAHLSADNPMLSAGERQRLLLARALYPGPSALLLDEGTANLDAVMLRQVLAMIRGQGVMCIIISHQSAVLAAVDRVLELKDGQLHEQGALSSGAGAHRSLCSPVIQTPPDD